MKCPQCSAESGSGKFCQECGHKVEHSAQSVVVCGGTQDDGEPCLEELRARQKFCPNCGQKVDQGLFKLTEQPTSLEAPAGSNASTDVAKTSGTSQESPGGGTVSEIGASENETGTCSIETQNAAQSDDTGTTEDREITNTDVIQTQPQPANALTQLQEDCPVTDGSTTQNILHDAPITEVTDSALTQSTQQSAVTPTADSRSHSNSAIANNPPEDEVSMDTVKDEDAGKVKGHPELASSGNLNIIIEDSNASENSKSEHSSVELESNLDAGDFGKSESLKPGVVGKVKMFVDNGEVMTRSEEDSCNSQHEMDDKSVDGDLNSLRRSDQPNDNDTDVDKIQDTQSSVCAGTSDTTKSTAVERERPAKNESSSVTTAKKNTSGAHDSKENTDGKKKNIQQKDPELVDNSAGGSSNETDKASGENDDSGIVTDNANDISQQNNGLIFGEAQRWTTDQNLLTSEPATATASLFSIDRDTQKTDNKEGTSVDGKDNPDSDGGSNTSMDKLTRRQKKNLKKRQKEEENAKALADSLTKPGGKQTIKLKDLQNPASTQRNTSAGSSIQTRSATNSAQAWSQPEREILVHFHVLVSEDFKLDSKDRQLAIKGNIFKEWQEDKICTRQGNGMEYVLSLTMPKSKITDGRRALYKYCIIDAKGGKSEYEFEHYKVKHMTGPSANRTLTVPPKWKDKDEWHQYDGYMERKPNIVQKLYNKYIDNTTLIQHVKKYVEVVSSKIWRAMRDDLTIQEGQYMLEILMASMRKVYYEDNQYWFYDKDLKKEVGKSLVGTALELLKQNHGAETCRTEAMFEKGVIMPLAIVYTVGTLHIDLSETDAMFLCKTLAFKESREDKECPELRLAELNFKSKEMRDAFIFVAKRMVEQTKNPSWLLLMPWIHFLSGAVKPYQALEVDLAHDKRKPVWWGTSHLGEDVVKKFKEQSGKWVIPLESMVDQLAPLFDMDHLLPRSLLAIVELRFFDSAIKTQKIPMEICIASLIYHLRTSSPRVWESMSVYETSEEKLVQQCAGSLVKRLQSWFVSDQENMASWTMCYSFVQDLLYESVQCNRHVTVNVCAQIAIHCIAIFDKVVENSDTDETVRKLTVAIKHWLADFRWFDAYIEGNLKVWDGMFAPVHLQSEKVRDCWNESITKGLMNTLNSQIGNDYVMTSTLVKLYCEKTDQYHPAMQECLSKTAFKTISSGYRLDYVGMNRDGVKRFGDLLSNMFNTEWYKAVKKGGSSSTVEERILGHVLHWTPFLHFLKIRDKDQDKMKLFYGECVERMIQAVSVVEMYVTALLDGSITIDMLKLISAPENRFDEIAEHVMQKKKQNSDFFKKAIAIRNREMDAFYLQASHMTTLTSLCEHIGNVDRRDVDRTLAKQDDIDKHCVKEFCHPASVDKVSDVTAFVPCLVAFPVSPEVIAVLPQIHACNESSTFLHLWQERGREIGNTQMTLADVVARVWQPVKQSWDKLSDQIKSGEITFPLMERMIGRNREDYDAMGTELQHMNIPQEIVRDRLEQLQQYRHLETCVQGARVILDFAKKYGLNGDFDNIRTIASHGQKDLQMKFFDENLMKTCKILEDLTKEKAHCLEVFVKCSPLIEWLKESMSTTGLKELKVFVDLAFMSAGEEPINVKRVQCLHSAVTAYAPLIFDLKPTSNYNELLKRCKLVWDELNANQHLPKQLMDTNRQLQWLKDIKKAHGSVEVTSLVQAETINACGIYTVGKGAWKNSNKEKMDGLMSVLQLMVSEVEGQRQRRNYRFSQLQDLQSRLMLVAGKAEKGSEGVENFTSVFDSIVRLCKVYLQLCSAGCVLFKEWTAKFLCDSRRPLCIMLEFGESRENIPALKGRRCSGEDLKEMVPRLANFLETCYAAWLGHIRDKRGQYLHLNFFTVDQLVILQRELVKCGTQTEDSPSNLVYPLLSAVKPDCTPADLERAMAEAKALVDRTETEQEAKTENTEENEEEVLPEEDETAARRQTFIEEIVDAGYPRQLAQQAVNHVEDFDVTEGIIWCEEHIDDDKASESDPGPDMEDEEEEMGTGDGAAAGPAFMGWTTDSQRSIQDMIASNIRNRTRAQEGAGFEPLRQELEELWTTFLGSISSSVSDYLSLEHLGLILQCLAKQNQFSVNRSLPPGYLEGEPNLLVCPSGDVLPMVLAIYMMNKDQPLPQSDEVLVCTQHTTVDEVDIFWKRALFGDTRKIHCLANVDLLDYNVSDTAERNLEEYRQSGTTAQNYKLVVLCGSDNENRSRIVSALDKCRRAALPVNLQGIRAYLENKLRVTDQLQGHGSKPASAVDFDNSSVRLVKSWRAGVGKTLYKTRTEAALARQHHDVGESVSIPLQEKQAEVHTVMERLLQHSPPPGQHPPKIFHIDVAHEVQYGVDYLLFNLLVLGCVTDKMGYVWRRSWAQLYLVETMPLIVHAGNQNAGEMQYVHKMLDILPDVTCRSPMESLDVYTTNQGNHGNDQLFDESQFRSQVFQRPFQYLWRHDQGQKLEDVDPHTVIGDPPTCLQILLRHCGVQDPSWAELHHFVWFLNTQLCDYESNNFVLAAGDSLPGFPKFVLRFLINMSRDFSTRSLKISEQSPGALYERQQQQQQQQHGGQEDNNEELELYQMRRTWESSPHPYLFINYDSTFTFLGFNIDRNTGNMIDQVTGQVLEAAILDKALYDSLVRHSVPIQENFDGLPRHEKILRLCSVMGLEMPHDPDDTYELTTDNVKKIMAIFMRFRCDIPVIIMGETGCGKTRLIKFMCSLQLPPGVEATNMILMKVHGGTTNEDIRRKVEEAERRAQINLDTFGRRVFTVLFFDEANTTEAIGLIKEIMCDKSLQGKKLRLCENLKIVAACNPYRKHSDELIVKLEQAGLGYHVDAEATCDRLGRVPMRRLVYRVQPLPQSLLPLVWDFGQLNTTVEDLYIRQMVRRYACDGALPDNNTLPGFVEVVSGILTASQEFMREQKDECSFVSLRDVDRVLSVMSWFYQESQNGRTLYDLMDQKLNQDEDNDEEEEEESDEDEGEIMEDRPPRPADLDDVTRSLVLALGVCYHACLRNRDHYRRCVAQFFRPPCPLPGGADVIEREIICCQDVFLNSVQLEKNIARNMALKENVFMMTVCIELRIPLFLVGKPGSSKSLAKTIVSDAMQGNASREELFRELKQAQMVSFQCSPLATPDGIVGTFRQCAQFQKDKDLNTFVSIVVLDEVGLAEDSPRMPLKTLHPLLEDGCQGDEKPEEYMKVAFIGISNWALDPAKMNRGILVQREVPDLEELENSARGICTTTDQNQDVLHRIEPLIKPMAKSYLEIFDRASRERREFYGLRDFYSLVKMVYAFMEKSHRDPTWHEIKHAVLRNFGGLDEVDPVGSFKNNLSGVKHIDNQRRARDPDCSPKGLIEACLFDTNNMQSESRYLLLLTENYGALNILQQEILAHQSAIRPITIFGSSFRSDQKYTQVCRNINKIKVCMETGNTVVLLNLENLYESLYDALNQYYVYFGGERYVDLGLGTHRVKCPVHRNFRLIVVAEKQTVYDKFPIPLINRLEKHFLTLANMLSPQQHDLVDRLEKWATDFVTQINTAPRHARKENSQSSKVGDVFMGYHDDTCSAIVIHVWPNTTGKLDDKALEQVLRDAQRLLLWCATPDAVVRLPKSALCRQDQDQMKQIYHEQQAHESLAQYLHWAIHQGVTTGEARRQLFVQVTTHSKLLPSGHREELSRATDIPTSEILLLDTLSSFDTEQQFSNKIQQFLSQRGDRPGMLVVQCDDGDRSGGLVACARYCVMDEYESARENLQAPVHVVFIIQLPRIAGGCFTGFQCGVWHSVHIDDLRVADEDLPTVQDMEGKSVATLLLETTNSSQQEEPMVTDDMASGDANHRSPVHGAEGMDWEASERSPNYNTNYAMGEPVPSTSHADPYNPNNNTQQAQPNPYSSTTPLSVEDVVVSLEMVGTHQDHASLPRGGGSAGPRKSLNVQNLILACVQEALSKVKDRQENLARTTDRVPLVLRLFHQNTGRQSFVHGVCHFIASLLKDKENSAYMANQWLTDEAANPDNIHRAGTFRRSCQQTLMSKISPILAGVIAFLDTNQNLDILDGPSSPWKQTLWLDVLNAPKAIPLKYSDLQSPKRKKELSEVIVMTTGCNGVMFRGQMPFSWLIYEQIQEVIEKPTAIQEEESEDVSVEERIGHEIGLFAGVLQGSSIGALLDQLQDPAVVEEATQAYVSDFLHMVYKETTTHEHGLVCQSILYVTNQQLEWVPRGRELHSEQVPQRKDLHSEQVPQGRLLQHLVSVHLAYKKLKPRLVYFQTMNQVWPECSQEIIELKEKDPDSDMFQEEEFTFSALCLLIEDLKPDKTPGKTTAAASKTGGKDSALNDPERRSHWLQKVYRYRQVIEKVIRIHTEDSQKYGHHSQTAVIRASYLWSRVVVMKLFLEHVCASKNKDAINIKNCSPLWTLLGEKTDLKEVKSLEGIEKYLKTCNKKAIKEFLGEEEKCCHCEVVLEGPPFVLPCKHILCDACLHDMKGAGNIICPTCKREVRQDWEPKRQVKNKQANEKLQDYQKRCNSFFMDVVSQLCFADNTPPSDAVIEKLMKYVLVTRGNTETGRRRVATTKEMSIFDTGIDPNPVFRSFLLQLMMRTSRETVTGYLEQYLEEADMLITGRDVAQKEAHTVSLCQLIIQCFEDLLLKESTSRPEEEEICVGMGYLRDARQVIDTDQLSVDKLRGLAEARIGLAITAKYIAETVGQDVRRVEPDVRRLIDAAQKLCTELRTKMPRTYLVKYLCRRYGMDTYQGICQSQQHFLRWIAMDTEQGNERVECADRYVVCGDMYTQIREALTKVIIGEDADHLETTLQGLRGDRGQKEVLFHLAVHREVTCSNLYPPARKKVTQPVIQKVEELVTKSALVKNKPLVQALVRNQLGGHQLHVQQGEALRVQGIQCLVIHFMSALNQMAGDGTLMQPLNCLMKTPQNAQNAYLPTMPQDDLEEVKEALLAHRGGENPVLYRCPNGHPYVIGDCGRPATVGTCKTCGSAIGGQAYVLQPGNQLHQGTDTTATGHILGRAANRGQGPKPERLLTPLHCACVRLLTHLAMYAGTMTNTQAVENLIMPNITPGSGAEFLWQHIMADLGDMERGTGKSPDDVLLLMHAIVHTMMTTHRPGARINAETCGLKSKKGRTNWEKQFSTTFLNPVLQDMNATLQQCNQQVLNDHRLGADPLLCLLYETEGSEDPVHPGMLQDAPSIWRYRTPISLEHLRQEFDAQFAAKKNHPHKVLQHFLREDHHLQAIRFIPGILRLHRMLLAKFLRRLDKEEAATMRIGDLKQDESSREIVGLIEDFAKAWDLLREDLKVYVCPTELGCTNVPKQYCSRGITDNDPIAFLLPSTRDMGLCSYAMLDFLMRKQNDFLTAYMKATGRSNAPTSIVAPRDITTAHLISYDPHSDILPLVLANCRYSFAMGSGTSIEYDFAGLERQLMDRFLFSKSRINIEETLKIDLMVYRAEVTNALVFKKLAEKIPQDVLSAAVKSQISEEMRALPELCTSLDNLDIAVSFLTSVGGEPSNNLYDFMAEILKMENSLKSQKARQECQFQHAQALWLHLSLLKSKEIANHRHSRESMFDNIEDQFHACLPNELLTQLRDYMKQLSVEKLSQLVEWLHEYIVLEVSVRDNKEDEDYVDKATKQLYGWLYGYFDNLERPNLDLGMLAEFPKEILIGHSSHAWAEAYRMLQEKKTGQRH